MNRLELLKRVGFRYEKFNLFGEFECTYCGRDTTGSDHVPALIESYCYHPPVKHLLVPCCNKCNSILYDKSINTLGKRAEYLYQVYENKFGKILDRDWWDEHEIDELSGLLRDDVGRQEEDRTWLEYILSHLEMLVVMVGKEELDKKN